MSLSESCSIEREGHRLGDIREREGDVRVGELLYHPSPEHARAQVDQSDVVVLLFSSVRVQERGRERGDGPW